MPKLWLLIENMDKMGRFGSGGGSTCWGSSKKWVFHPQVKWCLPFYSFKMLVNNPQTLLLAWVWKRRPFIWVLEQWNLETTEGEEMPLSCRFYLEEVLHSSPLSLDLCHGPRSHGLSSSRPLGPPFPRGWSSCPYPFHSSPVNCWLCLYSPDISLATQQSISWRCCYELQSTLPD